MTTGAQVATVLAVHDLLARCARHCDDRDLDAWTALFTTGARLIVHDVICMGDGIRSGLSSSRRAPRIATSPST